ncbi:MAG: lytic transglycosylase domain-containing protein [Thermodesulfobacteriota bacterium]
MKKSFQDIMFSLTGACQWVLIFLLAAEPAQAADISGRTILTGHQAIIKTYALDHNLPSSLIKAMIKTESDFNPLAVSPKGAKGLMQLMPEVCLRYGVKDPFNAEQNIKAGTAYFRELLDRFKNLTLALAAYNGGPEPVERYGGVPPFDETQEYIRQVYYHYNRFRREMDRHAPVIQPAWPPGTKGLNQRFGGQKQGQPPG